MPQMRIVGSVEVTNSLQHILETLRKRRGFDAAFAAKRKSMAINDYFSQSKLNAAVIGVSGGVDSAVALGLLVAASQQPNSPIRKIVAVLAPIYTRGASNQQSALNRGVQLRTKFSDWVDFWVCDLTEAQRAYTTAIRQLSTSAWAEGQLLSIVRTPAFYYAAALLQQNGYKSLVVGTTNRDEGAYLGFYGKASDGMVDLQPISDLHKSEVYQLAEVLDIPQQITKANPSGDVFDGRFDEEMIGAPYWFVELYLRLKEERELSLLNGISNEEKALFNKYGNNIEAQHAKNAHKYRVGSPAVHLDVYNRSIPGGWK